MKPFRAMQTAGFLKSTLDLAFWAIVLLAPVYASSSWSATGAAASSTSPSMLRTLLWLPVLYQLRKLLGALAVGRPFVRENAERLRRLGWTLILVVLTLTVLRLGEGLYVYLAWQVRRPDVELWPLTLDLPLPGLFVGAVLLVVAEAFRRGAQLEEDQALTV